jgi:hypothetical protein
MIIKNIESLSGKIGMMIDCILEIQELEAMCIIIPAYETLEKRLKKATQLNLLIKCCLDGMFILERMFECERKKTTEREIIFLMLEIEHKYHIDEIIKNYSLFNSLIRHEIFRKKNKRSSISLFD